MSLLPPGDLELALGTPLWERPGPDQEPWSKWETGHTPEPLVGPVWPTQAPGEPGLWEEGPGAPAREDDCITKSFG